jgi:hypothetical protein
MDAMKMINMVDSIDVLAIPVALDVDNLLNKLQL